jgi:hypothetical protein
MAVKKGKSLDQVSKAREKAVTAKASSATAPRPAPVDKQTREAFEALKGILKKHVPPLQVLQERPASYSVHSKVLGPDGKPYWFGGAAMRKEEVSFYLFPVYVEPALLNGVSPALRKKMEGKSSFSIERADPALIKELADLTAKGIARWKKGGVI